MIMYFKKEKKKVSRNTHTDRLNIKQLLIL